jgi:hypothetical protein
MVCISVSFSDKDEIVSRGTTVGAKIEPIADFNSLLTSAAGVNGLNRAPGKSLPFSRRSN